MGELWELWEVWRVYGADMDRMAAFVPANMESWH
jgi:hypothetical protein